MNSPIEQTNQSMNLTKYQPKQDVDFIRAVLHMQNVKRWKEYRPHFSDNAASHSYRVASYAVIAVLADKHLLSGQLLEADVIGKALLHDMNEYITGSIKHQTKKDVLVQPYIKQFEKEASKEILHYIGDEQMRQRMESWIINAEDETSEGRLVNALDTFDSMMFCFRETQYGSNQFFKKKYEELYIKMKEFSIPSIQWLMEKFDEKGDVYEFLWHILSLDTVDRWNGSFNLIPDEDTSHTFRVSVIAMYLSLYENRFLNKKIDLFNLFGKTLGHDLVESITGDVKGPLKHSTPETKKAFEEYEKQVSEMMTCWLPKELQSDMRLFTVDAKDHTNEGYLVDVADKLDALVKAKLEMTINPNYVPVHHKQLQKINRNFNSPSIHFFLDEILPKL